ncbi:thiosulfate oxidation carrier complex protein SoxZ [Methylosoma difficile]
MASIKIRAKLLDGNTQIRLLIAHPMETGRAIDKQTQQSIVAHFIQTLTVRQNGKLIVQTEMGSGISKDPYFAFMVNGGQLGDTISVEWQDNLGQRDAVSDTVK